MSEPIETVTDSHTNDLVQSNDGSLRPRPIRVGSRKSELALIQTNHVISLLRKLYPDQKFEIHKMTTVGDRILNISLPKIGEKSLFTKDLEDALRSGIVDFVVHSLKDLPTALPDGMAIGAVLEREDARDALVLAKHNDGKTFQTLPEGSIIGTSSLRRTAQLARLYPHLQVHDIRGNLNTRLAKLDADESKYAGIVLAQAGLVRMNWHKRINYTIEPSEILYAVGQGALAVECRSSDTETLEMLRPLICHETQCRILAERSFLKTLGGGCSAPVAVHSTLAKVAAHDTECFDLNVIGSVWSLDGQTEIKASKVRQLNLSHAPSPPSSPVDDNDLEIPTKKQKLSIDIGHDAVVSTAEPSPPQVVDHSNAAQTQNVDLVGLINIHSEAFQQCPHSKAVCPLEFAVGQDVMGQCPYFDQSGATVASADARLADSSRCPFKSAQAPTEPKPELANADAVPKQCPFLKQSSTIGVADAGHTDTADTDAQQERLFCGIYPHQCWPIETFERCEQLGKELAGKLIDNGALSVMERAQAEIRQKI